jgi:hypothetical protein
VDGKCSMLNVECSMLNEPQDTGVFPLNIEH